MNDARSVVPRVAPVKKRIRNNRFTQIIAEIPLTGPLVESLVNIFFVKLKIRSVFHEPDRKSGILTQRQTVAFGDTEIFFVLPEKVFSQLSGLFLCSIKSWLSRAIERSTWV